MARRIHVGTIGLQIRVEMGETITAASAYSLAVKKPSGATATWTPTIGTSTKFYYSTIEGDLNEEGTYVLQPHLTLGSWTGHGTPVSFSVVPAIL